LKISLSIQSYFISTQDLSSKAWPAHSAVHVMRLYTVLPDFEINTVTNFAYCYRELIIRPGYRK